MSRFGRGADAFGLADRIGQILIPTEEVVELTSATEKRSPQQSPWFYPGYVKVEMEITNALWHRSRNTPPRHRIFGVGNHPVPSSAPGRSHLYAVIPPSSERPPADEWNLKRTILSHHRRVRSPFFGEWTGSIPSAALCLTGERSSAAPTPGDRVLA